jgi:hypothetical protein
MVPTSASLLSLLFPDVTYAAKPFFISVPLFFLVDTSAMIT